MDQDRDIDRASLCIAQRPQQKPQDICEACENSRIANFTSLMGQKEPTKMCSQCLEKEMEILYEDWVQKFKNYYREHNGAKVVSPWVHY
jgi:hypothetical protein